ncbi:hypothetical protein [Herbiconiux sp. A18JL235]|uniref:Virginiamycin B lyase n=1 Tax=Herbiconiux sp. A18JL235 TaxID=3152363 RepID=A0AB39BFZ9_9MICO
MRSVYDPDAPALTRRHFGLLAVGAAAAVVSAGVPLESKAAGALEVGGGGFASWHEYTTPTAGFAPGFVTVDAGDRVWYDDGWGNHIVSFPSSAPASFVEYDLGPGRPGVSRLVPAPDGTVWFNDISNGGMGKLDPASGAVTAFPFSGRFDWGSSPVVGADGAIWFGWDAAGGLGRLALDGSITSFPVHPGSGFYHLVAGDDGRIWFTVDGYGSIGALDIVTGATEMFPVGPGNFSGIAKVADGSLWVARPNLLQKVSLSGSVVAVAPIIEPPFVYTEPSSLCAGSDYELYFVAGAHGMGRIEPDGSVAFFAPPFTGASVGCLAVTSTNSLWYTDLGRHTIGNI